MAGRLSGKVAFVTGAAQGIGRSIAEAFAREGAMVVAADLRRIDPGPDASPRIQWIGLDVTDEAAVTEIAREHRAYVLVNCVGVVASGTVLESTAAGLARSFEVNVISMATTIRAFLPAMLRAGEGSIVNIASVVSSTMGARNRFAYGTTKAAVIGLTKSVARDFIDRGIRCNSISPGTVMTPSFQQRVVEQGGDPADVLAAFVQRQPMGRLGQTEEIAEVAVLLASAEAGFMTGTDVVIDGGMSL